MKKLAVAVVFLAFAVCFGRPASAKNLGPSGNVSLDYWMADLTSNDGTSSDKADQNFFPLFSVLVDVKEGLKVIGEYSDSDSHSVKPADPPDNTKIDSKKFLIGVRRDFSTGMFVTLAYNDYKVNAVATTGTVGIKVNGVRIGGGLTLKIPITDWTGSVDVGFGVGNKGSYSMGAVSVNPGASSYDMNIKLVRKFPAGFRANLGYRYINMKIKSTTVGAATLGAMTFKVKGPYLGVGYDF